MHASLPVASTLCGACYEVCPVKIDIPQVLLHLRARAVESKGSFGEGLAMGLAGWGFRSRRRYELGQRLLAAPPRLRSRSGSIAQASRIRSLVGRAPAT